jgi:hypothetical protein
MTLVGGPWPLAREGGEKVGRPRAGGMGWEKAVGPRGEKERGEERPPDWAVRSRKEGWLGWAAREKWERKKKKESGPGPTRK